jgi:hypothetical protein
MKKIFLILLALAIASSIMVTKISRAQEPPKDMTEQMSMIIKKIDEVSRGQQEILNQIAEIKEELKIIKMRTALK